jgi:hypothetical protein
MIATGIRASASVWPPARWQLAAGRRAFPRPVQPGRNHRESPPRAGIQAESGAEKARGGAELPGAPAPPA